MLAHCLPARRSAMKWEAASLLAGNLKPGPAKPPQSGLARPLSAPFDLRS
jgi:hypothetical protein